MKSIPNSSQRSVARALRAYGRTQVGWARWKSRATKMRPDVANSFLLGVMLDRGVRAERAWDAGEWMVDSLSDWDKGNVRSVWRALAKMDPRRLRGFMRYGYGGYAFHWRYKTFARLLPRAAKVLLAEYDGDPRQIWNNQRNVNVVRDRLEAIPTIGPALANMTLLFLARDHGRVGGKKARPLLDPKPDIHVCRVFQRTGLVRGGPATASAVIQAAKTLAPDYPAVLDAPAWEIGRKWCRPRRPRCRQCPILRACPKIGIRGMTARVSA
jgi:endonuclease III